MSFNKSFPRTVESGKELFELVSDVNRSRNMSVMSHQHISSRCCTCVPTCGRLGMLSHAEVVWESVFFFFAAADWAAHSRPGKHPLWQSGLELCTNYTLSSS